MVARNCSSGSTSFAWNSLRAPTRIFRRRALLGGCLLLLLLQLLLGCFEVLVHRRCDWMRLAQHADAVVEGLLKQLDGLVQAARPPICSREVVARTEGIRMVLTQDSDVVSEGFRVQGDGLVQSACPAVCTCEVVERAEGAGVVFSEDIDTVIDGLFK